VTDAVAGLVLCGGGGRRMGADKATILVGGRPLVRVVAERLATFAEPVFLAPGVPGRLGALGYPEVADVVPDAGPLGGLAAGLEASPHPLLAVCAVDMPFASPEVFRVLVRARRADEDAVVPVTARGPQPLHAVYAASALPAIRAALREGSLRALDLLADLRVREVGAEEWGAADPSGRFAVNVNRPEDLIALGAGWEEDGPEPAP
jgi:molybdopterin-guanine dinucleotide biosynthesis protein A